MNLTPQLLNEMKHLLRISDIRHGQAFSAIETNMPAEELAANWRRTVPYTKRVIKRVGYMLEGVLPTSSSMALINSYGYRELWERGASPELLDYVQARLRQLQELNPEIKIEPMGNVGFPARSDSRKREAPLASTGGRLFGTVAGQYVGKTYVDRKALSRAKVHRPLQAGICGGKDGAESIVVSGGYVDDQDYGNLIIYTGHGGRDAKSGLQIADQELIEGNLALARNCLEGFPVRVVRGCEGDPVYSPPSGYRYDGLFRVDEHWQETGRDGFRIWRFRLVALSDDALRPPEESEDPGGAKPADRVESTIQRIVRSSQIAEAVKRLYDHTCQICGIRLTTPAGPYAEAAHIKALGAPHNGPDVYENLLCLCANDHVLFDRGAVYIDSSHEVRQSADDVSVGRLRMRPGHVLNDSYIAYHREHFAYQF
jgi:putative restriction endonuclease